MDDQPCLSFGVIADVQYADADDGFNYTQTCRRYYRTALRMLDKAVDNWNHDKLNQPQFVLNLGDAFDGLNKRQHTSESALADVVQSFSKFHGPVYHIWGNHEYYNFSRDYLLKSGLYSGRLPECRPVQGKAYYSCIPHPKLRILALDTYEISLLACRPGTKEYDEAVKYMSVNPNEDKNSAVGLHGEDRRFAEYNGALSDDQISWVEENLQEAKQLKQNVILMGHCSTYGPASDLSCLCWNAPRLLQTLQDHHQVVLCYLAGHDHSGDMGVDKTGIYHVTFPGVLENKDDADFGTMYMYKDRLELVGNGRVISLTMPLRYKLDDTES